MKPSVVKLSKLEESQARRDGTDGKPKPLTPAMGEALREELLFGKPGPAFGSGPAKAKLLSLSIDMLSLPDPGKVAAEFGELTDEGCAHYEREHGLPHLTRKADIRERIEAHYAHRLRRDSAPTPPSEPSDD